MNPDRFQPILQIVKHHTPDLMSHFTAAAGCFALPAYWPCLVVESFCINGAVSSLFRDHAKHSKHRTWFESVASRNYSLWLLERLWSLSKEAVWCGEWHLLSMCKRLWVMRILERATPRGRASSHQLSPLWKTSSKIRVPSFRISRGKHSSTPSDWKYQTSSGEYTHRQACVITCRWFVHHQLLVLFEDNSTCFRYTWLALPRRQFSLHSPLQNPTPSCGSLAARRLSCPSIGSL